MIHPEPLDKILWPLTRLVKFASIGLPLVVLCAFMEDNRWGASSTDIKTFIEHVISWQAPITFYMGVSLFCLIVIAEMISTFVFILFVQLLGVRCDEKSCRSRMKLISGNFFELQCKKCDHTHSLSYMGRRSGGGYSGGADFGSGFDAGSGCD